jgi:hypothetical protein
MGARGYLDNLRYKLISIHQSAERNSAVITRRISIMTAMLGNPRVDFKEVVRKIEELEQELHYRSLGLNYELHLRNVDKVEMLKELLDNPEFMEKTRQLHREAFSI